MKIFNFLVKPTICIAFAFTSQIAISEEFVSIKTNTANIREKPTTKSPIAWELIEGYPLKVTQKKGNWLKVRDIDGILGWIYKPITGKNPHFLVKVKKANLRSGASTNHRIVSKLEQYDVLQTLRKKNGWAKVETSEGNRGWVSQKLVWGW